MRNSNYISFNKKKTPKKKPNSLKHQLSKDGIHKQSSGQDQQNL